MRQKSAKVVYVEQPSQTVEENRFRIVTPAIPLLTKKSIAHKIKKQPCKVDESEWTPVIVDYAKLHKHYLKLSKIKLTCMYIRFMSIL